MIIKNWENNGTEEIVMYMWWKYFILELASDLKLKNLPHLFPHCIYGLMQKDITALLMHWSYVSFALTHGGQVMHICVSKLTIIDSDNGLSPGWRQAINWTNAGILLTGPLGTNFSETLIEICTFSFKKMHLKMSSGKWRPFCFALNVSSCPYIHYIPLPSRVRSSDRQTGSCHHCR